MDGKKRAYGRRLADYFAAGFPARKDWDLDYYTFFALEQHVKRILIDKPAAAAIKGIKNSGTSELGRWWADALATDTEEIDEILEEANHQRAIARARNKKRPF